MGLHLTTVGEISIMLRQCLLALALAMSALDRRCSGKSGPQQMFKITEHDFGTVARGAKAEYDSSSRTSTWKTFMSPASAPVAAAPRPDRERLAEDLREGGHRRHTSIPPRFTASTAPRSPSFSTSPSTPKSNCTSTASSAATWSSSPAACRSATRPGHRHEAEGDRQLCRPRRLEDPRRPRVPTPTFPSTPSKPAATTAKCPTS